MPIGGVDPAMLTSNTHILAVDDSQTVRRLLSQRLEPLCDRLTLCGTVAEARAVLAAEPVDVALLDVVLPDGDGYELCTQILGDTHHSGTIVMFLSMKRDAESKVRGLQLGATDFLTKPFHPEELRARVAVALRQKATADMLQQYAEADPLSGLGNRRRFDRLLPAEIERCRRMGETVSLLVADIDGFKSINDTRGHPVGDRVLASVAGMLDAAVSSCGQACRLGGDEFAACVTGVDEDESLRLGQELCDTARASSVLHQLAGHAVTLSVGVATVIDAASTTASALLASADNALYAAKRRGRDHASSATDLGQARNGSAAA